MAVSLPAQLVKPLYVLYRYTDDVWKIVLHKGGGIDAVGSYKDHDDAAQPAPDGKFSQAFSRARSTVLELALCNKWDYFCTFTLDGQKHDRFNLYSFLDDFSQWIRNERKRTGADLRFLVVPEYHVKGGVHAHGLLSGIRSEDLRSFLDFDSPVPEKLLAAARSWDCRSWEPYRNKFGYCSCSPVQSAIGSAFYIAKYLSKDVDCRTNDYGRHLYRASRGLNRAERFAESCVFNRKLEDLCVHDSQFCKTGFATPSQRSAELRVDWAFPVQFDGMEILGEEDLWPELAPVDDTPADTDAVVAELEQFDQLFLGEMCGYDT